MFTCAWNFDARGGLHKLMLLTSRKDVGHAGLTLGPIPINPTQFACSVSIMNRSGLTESFLLCTSLQFVQSSGHPGHPDWSGKAGSPTMSHSDYLVMLHDFTHVLSENVDYNGIIMGLFLGFRVCSPFPSWSIAPIENPALGCMFYDWGIGSGQMKHDHVIPASFWWQYLDFFNHGRPLLPKWSDCDCGLLQPRSCRFCKYHLP